MSVGTDAAMEMGSLMSRPLADSGSESRDQVHMVMELDNIANTIII